MEIITYVYLTFSLIICFSLTCVCYNTAVNKTCSLMKSGIWTCNYIPMHIPDGVEEVHINNFIYEVVEFEVNHTYFMSEDWQSVKYLEIADENKVPGVAVYRITFKNDTFRNLKELKELHIHIYRFVLLEPDSLSGLENVRILDLSQCSRLKLNYIKGALNGSEKVPNLEQLLLSQVDHYGTTFKIDREFGKCLAQKPVFHLDLSKTRISIVESQVIKDLVRLKKLNFSGAVINIISHENTSPEDLQILEVVDFSYALDAHQLSVPSSKQSISLSNANLPIKKINHYRLELSIGILNISGVTSNGIVLHNCKAWWLDSVKSRTREIIARENNLYRLDVNLACDNVDFSSMELFNLANNGLEYMHPSIFGCFPNLASLDLSDNKLHVMYKENITLFSVLLKGTAYVKSVSLAVNGLTDIPDDFFVSNTLLEMINLAGNRLTQVHFGLRHLQKLRVLNLASNDVKVLDVSSIQSLDALSAAHQLGNASYESVSETTSNATVEVNSKTHQLVCNIKGNPLLCDTCDTKTFISWLSNADFIDTQSNNVDCKRDTGERVNVNKEAVTIIQHVCDRKTRNIILITMAVVVIIGGPSLGLILYLRRRRDRKERRRNEVINDLRHDDGHFAVFLSYSSDDFDFVEENVVLSLNEGLQEIIGTDRNLVCQGDTEFRLGRYVHNESLRCIELTEVFLCVISNSYCNSNYCDSEFNQALVLKKPVLLMMKDEVDVDLMTPTMQLLFRDNVRVLWEYDNGQYRLKTTWQNVCESIVDLATN